mmetsp:Transcript_138493/g.430677  ORF Transcript_138493/g.430677 Transcript_138493/m.430677 type:complete len:264 (-) Transcript_138493:125-916(-)
MRGELLPANHRLRDGQVGIKAKHAEAHLCSTLVISHLVLEEGDTNQVVRRVMDKLHDFLKIRLLVEVLGGVVLADEDWRALKVVLVVVQEEIADVEGGVRGVDAVHEPGLVQVPEVVVRSVVYRRGVLHGLSQRQHLADAGLVAHVGAARADPEGEGDREVGRDTLHSDLLLGIYHRIEGAHQGSAEMPGLAQQLEIWLIHEDDRPELWVVSGIILEETTLQIHDVLLLDHVVAVKVRGHAVALHLRVRVVAEAGNDVQVVFL